MKGINTAQEPKVGQALLEALLHYWRPAPYATSANPRFGGVLNPALTGLVRKARSKLSSHPAGCAGSHFACQSEFRRIFNRATRI